MRAIDLRVGLLALLAAALLLGAVLFFGSQAIRHGVTYETYFRDSVQGLDVGAPVKYRGVAIGQVTSIALVNAVYGSQPSQLQDDPAYRMVLARLDIDPARIGAMPNIAALVAQGLRARIAPQGLTGQSYVELDFLDPERFPAIPVPWTPLVPYIPSARATLSQVEDAATTLLGKIAKIDIEGLANGLQAVLGDLRGTLHGDRLPALMTEVSDTLRLVRVTITAADIPGTVADLRQTLAAARTLAQGPQTRDLLRNATQATDRLNQALAKLPPLLATLQDVARRADAGSADAEAALAPLLRDTRAAVADLRATAAEARQDPGQVVLQGPPPHGLPP
jgi:paraquat-inducible protein B